jgi:hypothetical protein
LFPNRLQLSPRPAVSIEEVFSLMGGLRFDAIGPGPFCVGSSFRR